jgi:hypothetical protein
MDAVATKDVEQGILSGILSRQDMERVEQRGREK